MATVSLKVLGVLLLAGAIPVLADDAGKAAAKAYARPSKPVASRPAAGREAAPARAPEAAPGPGRMQVEEPSEAAATGARASKAWQKSHPKGLTETQKAAFRERKEKMEGMIALIKAKRQALREAKPEERAAIARELHVLILEKEGEPGSAAAAAARVEDKGVSEAEAGNRKSNESVSAEAQSQRREDAREWQAERRKARKAKDNGD